MADDGRHLSVREMLHPLAIVALVGLLLFGATGVWPPMVAVESGSMDPHIRKGDLVVVTEPERWTVSAARDSGVVTARDADG